ncbi:OmpA family protein, partial [Acinetobacter baumannii]
ILLQPIELNADYVFNNILFSTNAYELPKEAHIELDKLIQVLQENPSLQIEIGGHTDNIGKPEDNNKLSTERAKSIANYIIGKGIA